MSSLLMPVSVGGYKAYVPRRHVLGNNVTLGERTYQISSDRKRDGAKPIEFKGFYLDVSEPGVGDVRLFVHQRLIEEVARMIATDNPSIVVGVNFNHEQAYYLRETGRGELNRFTPEDPV